MKPPIVNEITEKDICEIANLENLDLSDQASVGILTSSISIDVQACPGSGKTTLIAIKLMLLARIWQHEGRGICVLSHTNVAKEEIVRRIEKSALPEAKSLLSYPHFIGTIQEFTDRYIALPDIRSEGVKDVAISNDEYYRSAKRMLDHPQFFWLRGMLKALGSDEEQEAFLKETHRNYNGGGMDVNMSKMARSWRSASNFSKMKLHLEKLKKQLDQDGRYLYRDMYTLAEDVITNNQELTSFLVRRFPYIFLDEMQDTYKHQDELLQKVFCSTRSDLVIHRFGDPDQAIFKSSDQDQINDSFNEKSASEMDFVVNKSHRFSDSIAKKIANLSINRVDLKASAAIESSKHDKVARSSMLTCFQHTIFVFDESSILEVIPMFIEMVSKQFCRDYSHSDKFLVKIVGAVGNSIDSNKVQLKIGHYWRQFQKKMSSREFRGTFVEAVRHCRSYERHDDNLGYKFLVDGIIRELRLAKVTEPDGKQFSRTSFQSHLEKKGKWRWFRKLMYGYLSSKFDDDERIWNRSVAVLKKIVCSGQCSQRVNEYFSFSGGEVSSSLPNTDSDGAVASVSRNCIDSGKGFSVDLSTIHGVKGETHDATLVLETKFHEFDMEVVLPALIDEASTIKLRKKKRASQFMRQFYVAMSRPKHLLCLAIRSDHINDSQRDELTKLGWCIENV